MPRSLKRHFPRVSVDRRVSFAAFEIARGKKRARGRRGKRNTLVRRVLRFQNGRLHRSGNHRRIVARARIRRRTVIVSCKRETGDSSLGRTDGVISASRASDAVFALVRLFRRRRIFVDGLCRPIKPSSHQELPRERTTTGDCTSNTDERKKED